ncbi:winged helix-turn-helix transcriptional regulator [soil metagenome]
MLPAVTRRSYGQYCPVASALEVIGERWTLLIVRELLVGPRRFSDLAGALPGISPNLLAGRLDALQAEDVVVREELPPPIARTVYTLTDHGRGLIPVVSALARWGAHRLGPPGPETRVRPAMAVRSAVLAWFDPAAAAGIELRCRLEIDGETANVRVRNGRLNPIEAVDVDADLRLGVDAVALMSTRVTDRSLGDLEAAGSLTRDGSDAAFHAFARAFRFSLDGPVEPVAADHTAAAGRPEPDPPR